MEKINNKLILFASDLINFSGCHYLAMLNIPVAARSLNAKEKDCNLFLKSSLRKH